MIFFYIVLTGLFFVNSVYSIPYKTIVDEDAEPYKQMPEPRINEQETETKYWREKGLQSLQEKLKQKLNTNVAKNVIFFMGDGMSIPTLTAARIYQGQLKKQNGEENQLYFQNFPYTGLSKTYCVDRQVADSASTSTAYMSGVKANFMTVGVTAKVKCADCESAKIPSNRPSSIVKWAQDVGKATGVITNTRITHASPSGAYAHVPYRYMECDADIHTNQLDPQSCNFDIAKQLIYDTPGKNIKVIMGGGRDKFLPQTGASSHGWGSRLDKDLVQEWKNDKKERKANGVYVSTAQELEQVDVDKTDYLLGLFAPDHMEYHTNRPDNEPTLSQMTEKAIKILQKENNGFFLFVEGGKIDIAHHDDQVRRALDETVEFDKAVEIASKLTSEEDTLIVVTADHAHTMSMNGYPARGFDILGIYGKSNDGHPYATLSYANGPGYRMESTPGQQHNLTQDNMSFPSYSYPAMVPLRSETHGGDDVAVFARGPWAHLFVGNYEQSYIPIAEAYAAKIPVPKDSTDMTSKAPPQQPTTSAQPTTEDNYEQSHHHHHHMSSSSVTHSISHLTSVLCIFSIILKYT